MENTDIKKNYFSPRSETEMKKKKVMSSCCDTRPEKYTDFLSFSGPCDATPFTAFETVAAPVEYAVILVQNFGLCPLTIQFTSNFCEESVQIRVVSPRDTFVPGSQLFTVSKLIKIVTFCDGGSEENDACNYEMYFDLYSCQKCKTKKCGKKKTECCNNRPIKVFPAFEDQIGDDFQFERRTPCDGNQTVVFDALDRPVDRAIARIENRGVCPIVATFTTKGGQIVSRSIEPPATAGARRIFFEIENVKTLHITCSEGSSEPESCSWRVLLNLFKCLNCDKKKSKKRHGKHKHH